MKKHISLMKTLITDSQQELTGDYIRELEIQMSDKIRIVRTNYPVLSALLTEQKQRAKTAGIPFDVSVRLESEMNMEPVDLCVVLGNLFDNALEACLQISPEQDRWIKTSIMQRNNAVAIEFENSYTVNVKPHGRPGKHGLGLKNVLRAVDRHGGKVYISEEERQTRPSILRDCAFKP